MKIIDNSKEGGLILGYVIRSKKRNIYTNAIVTCDQANSFEEAIEYYYNKFHREGDIVISICYSIISKDQLNYFNCAA